MTIMDDPAYVEAYPRLSVGAAWKNRRTEATVLLWRDQANRAIGIAETFWPAPDQLVIHPHIRDMDYCEGTTTRETFHITWKGSTPQNIQPYAVCFACGTHHQNCVYANLSWRCKSCHRLVNRSAKLDHIVNITEELEKIEDELADGRPHRMRQSIFEIKKARMLALREKLGERRRDPDSRYRFLVSGEWGKPSPFEDHFRGTLIP